MDDLTKRVYEERIFVFDFSSKMARGIALASVDAIVIEDEGLVSGTTNPVTAGAGSVADQRAWAKFSGGVDGERYKITFRVTDTDGQKLEGVGHLLVSNS